jgi:hypothetical protein
MWLASRSSEIAEALVEETMKLIIFHVFLSIFTYGLTASG